MMRKFVYIASERDEDGEVASIIPTDVIVHLIKYCFVIPPPQPALILHSLKRWV